MATWAERIEAAKRATKGAEASARTTLLAVRQEEARRKAEVEQGQFEALEEKLHPIYSLIQPHLQTLLWDMGNELWGDGGVGRLEGVTVPSAPARIELISRREGEQGGSINDVDTKPVISPGHGLRVVKGFRLVYLYEIPVSQQKDGQEFFKWVKREVFTEIFVGAWMDVKGEHSTFRLFSGGLTEPRGNSDPAHIYSWHSFPADNIPLPFPAETVTEIRTAIEKGLVLDCAGRMEHKKFPKDVKEDAQRTFSDFRKRKITRLPTE